jgi:adenylate cyclase
LSDIFISYSHEDKADAQRFSDAFAAEGFSVWWDNSLTAGDSFDMHIETAIKAAEAVVVLWSENSVSSRWVRAEAMMADRLRTLIPVIIRECDLPIMFELTHTVELFEWKGSVDEQVWKAFIKDVRQITGRQSELHAAPASKTLSPHMDSNKPTIIILPFSNMSGEVDQEYFSDGISEDIITDLGKVSALSVVSRRTAFSFKEKAFSALDAKALQVSYILEGSIRKSGNRVRITAQLLDASSDAQIWAERFDRTLDDIFAMQDEISKAIIDALEVTLAPAEKLAIERRTTTNPEAYDLFVMARQFSRAGSERMQPIIERLCLRVVEIDPDFAIAWALIAFVKAEMKQRSVHGPDDDGGLFAAKQAVSLDPNLAEGHAALAEVLGRSDEINIAVGEPYVRRALELNADCYEANLYAGYVFLGQRRYAEAIQYYEKAADLDRVAYRPAGMVIQAYVGLGENENALAAARRCVDRCEKLLAVEPDHSGALGFYVGALLKLGEMERAKGWADRAVIFHPDNLRLRYNLASGFAEVANTDKALELLGGVINDMSGGWLRWVEDDNAFDPIRNDLRFKDMVERAKSKSQLP